MNISTASSSPSAVRRGAAFAGRVLLGGALFTAGAGLAPRIAGATISAGERDAFVPLAPARIFDTRDGTGLVGGVPAKIGAGQTVEFQVRGQGGVSASATAVTLNVTALNASATTHLTVFPGGTVAPGVSSLNVVVGQIVPNAVTVKIGSNGKVAVRNNSGTIDVFADVNGFYDDHNHDDRYYTKAVVDTMFAASDYVGSAQIANGSVTINDLAVSRQQVTGTVAADVAVAAQGCAKIVNAGGAMPGGVLVIPKLISTTASSLNGSMVAQTYAPLNPGVLQVTLCNRSASAVTLSAGSYTFELVSLAI